MRSSLLVLVAFSAFMLASLVALDGSDGALEQAGVLAILGPEHATASAGELTDLLPVGPGSLRHLGVRDDAAFLTGTDAHGAICLIILVPNGSGDGPMAGSACATAQRLAQRGLMAGLSLPAEDITAFLLPDGYEAALSTLSWAEALGPNVIVVDEGEAVPATEVRLVADDPERPDLVLNPNLCSVADPPASIDIDC